MLDDCLEKLCAMWENKAPKSKEYFLRAIKRIPSGVCHDMRSRLTFSPYYDRASGAYKSDLDGNEYLDMWMGHGSLIMGHAYPPVVEAIADQAGKGTHLGGSNPYEVELAEQICDMVPGIDGIRFVMSGTEATMLAIRVARAATGRPGIIKFAEHFHGWHDSMSVGRQQPYEVPLGGGLPEGVCEDIGICEQGDIDGVRQILESYAGIAAVIIEPTGAHGGQGPLSPSFLHELRNLTRKHGVLLIFDEIITGFRVAPGGAQELLGIEADLVCYAKVMAGGLPGGAVAGKDRIMQLLAFGDNPHRNRYSKVHHNGTHNSNPCTSRAGLAVLKAVSTDEPIKNASASADRIIENSNNLFRARNLPWRIYGGNSIFHLNCGMDMETAELADNKGFLGLAPQLLQSQPSIRKLLDLALLLNGLDLPTGGQAWTSNAHGEKEADLFVEKLSQSIELLKETGGLK